MDTQLTQSLDFHARALMLRSERQRLIASNIANADTPGYVAREIDFPAALARATGNGRAGSSMIQVGLNTTAAGHLPLAGAGQGTPATTYALASQPSPDRNTVDMDRERASFTDNAIRYESTLRFMNFHIRTIMSAIQGQ